jgi:hypothetical protein
MEIKIVGVEALKPGFEMLGVCGRGLGTLGRRAVFGDILIAR